jgi:hypothetical protein
MSKVKIKTNLNLSRKLNKEEQEYFDKITTIDVLNFTLNGNLVTSIKGTEFEYTNDWIICEDKILLKENLYNEYFFIESLLYIIDNFLNHLNIELHGTIRGFDRYFDIYFSYNILKNKIYLEYEINESMYTMNNIESLMEKFDLSD